VIKERKCTVKDMKVKEQFIEMRAQGLSFNAIAEKLQVSKSTLIEWSRELELEISNMRSLELEALQEQYFISKKKRVELFGEQVRAIKAELDTRDLQDVSTEKLYGIMVKLMELLKAEEAPVKFRVKESLMDMLHDPMTVSTWQP